MHPLSNAYVLFSSSGKLTRSKSVPASTDQIRKHREQRRQLEHWRKDVSALKTILDNLKKAYSQHKGDFALGRYDELKEMIKSAVAKVCEVVKENSGHRYDSGTTSQVGTVSSLCRNAESFAKHQETLSNEEKYYAGKITICCKVLLVRTQCS